VLKRAASVHDGVRPPGRGVVVLCYHRVGERSRAAEIDLPVREFEAQMAMVAERADPITLDDALAVLGTCELPGRDPVVVTFDDGTADFVDVVVPVLVRHGIPAVLYVATDFVERGCEFPAGGRPVSWAGLCDAVSTGLVTLGSHTHTHALLDRVDAVTAAHELDRSRELLAERTGVQVEHFAYPKAVVGNAPAEAAIRTRFRSAAVGGTRANRYGATDRYRLARSPVQRSDGREWFERKLAGGLRLEDDVRRWANRVRYIGAST
jgi:peptidoglycan/xylan/chitin deacetylase (PgdA/CDA1 family)